MDIISKNKGLFSQQNSGSKVCVQDNTRTPSSCHKDASNDNCGSLQGQTFLQQLLAALRQISRQISVFCHVTSDKQVQGERKNVCLHGNLSLQRKIARSELTVRFWVARRGEVGAAGGVSAISLRFFLLSRPRLAQRAARTRVG